MSLDLSKLTFIPQPSTPSPSGQSINSSPIH
jgi:hypothetical protein